MPARLIAIDMDGTLLGPDGQVGPRTLIALGRAEAEGVEVVIATGRRHCYAMRVLRELQLNPVNALISSNGTVVRTIGSDLLNRTLMPLKTARWVCEHMTEFRSTLVLTFDQVGPQGEDSRGALVVEQVHELHTNVGAWMRANEPYIAQVPRLEAALETAPPIQMMLCGPVALMRQAETRLLEHEGVYSESLHSHERLRTAEVALHRTEYTERDLCILDILPAGCSKGAAVTRLSEQRGLQPAHVLAVGDNWNDVSMLEVAGSAVLMGNAPEELKLMAARRGWSIGRSNAEEGAAEAIERFLDQPKAAIVRAPMVV